MPVWLGGAGRSDEELERLVRQSKGGTETDIKYRRAHERYPLQDVHGDLVFQGWRSKCQVLEISLGGCSLESDQPFRAGALAQIEVILPILQMVLHIGGTTQWIQNGRKMGIRFTHTSLRSRQQLTGLIGCINGQKTPDEVRETIAAPELNPNAGDVLAVLPPEPEPDPSELPGWRRSYDSQVHGGEGRIYTANEGEWPITLRTPDDRFQFDGAILDLSLGGCTVRTEKLFIGEIDDPLAVDFELQRIRFLISGVTQSIYNPRLVGIRFTLMSRRKREELAQVLQELCASANTELEIVH